MSTTKASPSPAKHARKVAKLMHTAWCVTRHCSRVPNDQGDVLIHQERITALRTALRALEEE